MPNRNVLHMNTTTITPTATIEAIIRHDNHGGYTLTLIEGDATITGRYTVSADMGITPDQLIPDGAAVIEVGP